MKLLDVINSQWAIMPEHLNGVLHIANSHNQGDKLDLKAIEKAIFEFQEEEEPDVFEEQGDIAVVPITGVLMKRPGALERILFDAGSMEKIKQDLDKAISDSSVSTILLYVDSPGGTVDGTKELADYIFSLRDKKKIIAFSDGVMASAAYWIASAAEEIYISNETVSVGSIGVITSHVDVSAYNEGNGIKVTDIFAGEFKAAGSENKPLDEKSSAYLQDRVDYIYSVFVNDVSRHRKQSTAFVVDRMAKGRVFLGGKAIQNKLVDGVSTFENLITELSSMNKNDFMAKHDDLYKEIKADIEKEMSEKFNAEKSDIEIKALESERERISGIQALSMPGHEKVIEDGISKGLSAADVSMEIIKVQKESLRLKAEEFEKDGPEVIPEVEPVDEEDPKDFMSLVKDYMKEKSISATEARAMVIVEHSAAYDKYRGK